MTHQKILTIVSFDSSLANRPSNKIVDISLPRVVAEHVVKGEGFGRLSSRCVRISHAQIAVKLVNLICQQYNFS
jgi:hypothetical protein